LDVHEEKDHQGRLAYSDGERGNGIHRAEVLERHGGGERGQRDEGDENQKVGFCRNVVSLHGAIPIAPGFSLASSATVAGYFLACAMLSGLEATRYFPSSSFTGSRSSTIVVAVLTV